jgi:hypothetical protein
MRIPSASFASTLPRMAIPDHDEQGAPLNTNHVTDTVLVDFLIRESTIRIPPVAARRPTKF